ncbi:MAG TPA: rRNA maturation RNase YbeY [Candidatus Omnitrophota bacterium]|nr:rRNA maturation RNase YbeY [Candidatus Omnitrophota bacterium]
MPIRLNKRVSVVLSSVKKLPASRSFLLRVGGEILRVLGKKRYGVNFCFVSDAEIRRMNRRFKKKDRVTDVLAFGQLEGPRLPSTDAHELGDVVISADAARREALRYGNTPLGELVFYMIHGVLHLANYDDTSPSSRLRMRAKEEWTMKRLEKRFPRWRFRKPKR